MQQGFRRSLEGRWHFPPPPTAEGPSGGRGSPREPRYAQTRLSRRPAGSLADPHQDRSLAGVTHFVAALGELATNCICALEVAVVTRLLSLLGEPQGML